MFLLLLLLLFSLVFWFLFFFVLSWSSGCVCVCLSNNRWWIKKWTKTNIQTHFQMAFIVTKSTSAVDIMEKSYTYAYRKTECHNRLPIFYYLLFNLSASAILDCMYKLFPWFRAPFTECICLCERIYKSREYKNRSWTLRHSVCNFIFLYSIFHRGKKMWY